MVICKIDLGEQNFRHGIDNRNICKRIERKKTLNCEQQRIGATQSRYKSHALRRIHQTQTDDHGKTAMIIGHYSDSTRLLFMHRTVYRPWPQVSRGLFQFDRSSESTIRFFILVANKNKTFSVDEFIRGRTFVNYYEFLFSILLRLACARNINV